MKMGFETKSPAAIFVAQFDIIVQSSDCKVRGNHSAPARTFILVGAHFLSVSVS
jgi:hypothetical protein